MSAWPSTLPQSPQAEGFSQLKDDNVIRSQQATGPAKTRRRTTAATQPFSFQLTLTDAQLSTFLTFHTTTLKDGSLSFTWVDHLNGGAASCRFTSQPVYSKNSGWWVVICNMEVLP